ncbi:hypothetical protein OPQ81_006758 [Rhizoctonia solani]|nr:hypothetical protein OPQ81_006758 [Rhizoctonia solani]
MSKGFGRNIIKYCVEELFVLLEIIESSGRVVFLYVSSLVAFSYSWPLESQYDSDLVRQFGSIAVLLSRPAHSTSVIRPAQLIHRRLAEPDLEFLEFLRCPLDELPVPLYTSYPIVNIVAAPTHSRSNLPSVPHRRHKRFFLISIHHAEQYTYTQALDAPSASIDLTYT